MELVLGFGFGFGCGLLCLVVDLWVVVCGVSWVSVFLVGFLGGVLCLVLLMDFGVLWFWVFG